MKAKLILNNLIYACVGILFGILLLVIPTETIVKILFILLGVSIIVFQLIPLINSIKALKFKTTVAYSQFLYSCIIIVLGILMIFFPKVISIILGILLIIYSLFCISLAHSHNLAARELITQLPRITFAILLLIFGIGTVLEVLVTIVGWVIIVLSVLFLATSIYMYCFNSKKQ